MKQKTAGVTIELLPGDRGIFDVCADGRLIFSKKQEGRFPTPADIRARLWPPSD